MSTETGISMPLESWVLDQECHNIAKWWLECSQDHENGGFWGELSADAIPVADANKGVILNTRILWFFSEAARLHSHAEYRKMADRAFHFVIEKFDDKQFGGVLWELNCSGTAVNGKKQIYAQSFAIYALSAYYQLTGNEAALTTAMDYFSLVEQHGTDQTYGGYLEAFARDWSPLNDVRLSEKDLNSPKSMNTHIHLLEAYTRLYQVSQSKLVGDALQSLITLICEKIINQQTAHLYLFQGLDWQDHSDCISFGHDIECSWLIWDALNVLDNSSLLAKYRKLVILMADTCLRQSIGDLGQVCDKLSLADNKIHQQSYWWVQAEALVGFLNAYKLTGNAAFYQACEKIWHFTQTQHIDRQHGEWRWLALRDQNSSPPQYKAGFWKAPYHNGRAMMEASALLNEIAAQRYEMAK